MGGTCSRQKPLRFLIQGLDAAGKTSLLYKMKLGEVVTTIPTIGFNVETVNFKHMEFTCWDVGGRDKMRPLFRHYYPNTDGLVYVVDSGDRDRLDQALDELTRHVLNNEELQQQGTIVMVVANKQDLGGALSPEQIEYRLEQKLEKGSVMSVFVVGCSVTTGEGVWEAFSMLADLIKAKKTSTNFGTGLMPRAWACTRVANQEAGNNNKDKNKTSDVKKSKSKEEAEGESPTLFHAIKNSWLKDPFNLFKSILSY